VIGGGWIAAAASSVFNEMAMPDLPTIVSGTRRLQPEPFESFYAATWQTVYRPLAVTLRDPDLAGEATDEAMTRAYQHWRRVREMGNPEGWVYRVALNWARSRLRRRRREAPDPPADLPAREVEESDPAVARAVASLRADHRAVIVLRYLCDLSQEQIAERLDLPVGTVRSRLHRALEQLRLEVSR
jgi:RNA polymerase sigma-70 factor (ECF subfamily)